MKKFLATLLLAAVMLTGASFCVEYEPAAALEPVVTPVHAVAEQVNLTEKRLIFLSLWSPSPLSSSRRNRWKSPTPSR